MIIDCHAHIADHNSIPSEFISGWSKSMFSNIADKSIGLDTIFEITQQMVHFDEDATKLISSMDIAGISKTILLPIDFGYVFNEIPLEYYKIINIHYCKIAQESKHRLLTFAGVDPRRGTAGAAFLEYLISNYDIYGLKLYPPCGFYPNDKILDSYYEICKNNNIPVLVHIGPTSSSLPFKYAHPKYVEDAAYRHPDVNFILAHGAIVFLDECIQICRYRPNVYMDMSGFQSIMNGGEFERHLKTIKNNELATKLLFGTDFPFYNTKWSYSSCMESINILFEKLYFTENEVNAIMGNTIKTIINL